MENRVITISREYGSGGRMIGRKLAEKLGIHCYDAEDRTRGLTTQDNLWNVQCQVIAELADKESCVIVGRCADYILRARADCLTVFIHADRDTRDERIAKEYGVPEDSVVRRRKEKDKRRAAYYQFYTDMKWGDARNYHICLDSGELGIDKCVDILAQLY